MKILYFGKDHAMSHDENRLKICLICGVKKKTLFEITDSLNKLVNKYFVYNSSDERLPKALCALCKSKLYANEKSAGTFLISTPDLAAYNMSKITRSKSSKKCDCKVCLLARGKGKSKSVVKAVSKSYPDKKCSECGSVLAKGKRHDECNKKTLLKNLSSSFDEKMKEHVISHLLQEKVENSEYAREVSLSRIKGKPMTVSIGHNDSSLLKSNQISTDDVLEISVDHGLTTNTTLSIARSLRVKTKNRDRKIERGRKQTKI